MVYAETLRDLADDSWYAGEWTNGRAVVSSGSGVVRRERSGEAAGAWNGFSIYGKELFGCNDVEIRQNGVELQRIPFIDRTHVGAGNPCGHDTVEPGYSVAHAGRLPLHLKYRFEKPGFYQLRYTQIMHPQASVQSDWTTIDVQPAQFEALPSAPAAPYEIMSDFLPNLLAVRDMETRAILARYLKDSNEEVRPYATASLGYWP